MKIELTNEEKEAIELYKNGEYQVINQLLVSDSNSDISLIREDVENKSIKINYERETLIRDLKTFKIIYELLVKIKTAKGSNDDWAFVRGSNIAEAERFRTELFIDKAIDASKDKDIAEKKYAVMWNEPAVMYIRGDSQIPYIDFSDIIGMEDKYKNDVIISPFTKLKSISTSGDLKIENKVARGYNMILEKQELQGMTKEDKQNLYINILGNSDYINLKINEIVRLEKESNNIYENIRHLEQIVAKHETELEKKRHLENVSDYEIKVEEDNITSWKNEVGFLKKEVSGLYDKIKECTEDVTNWKKTITVYVMSECYDIEVKYNDVKPEEVKGIVTGNKFTSYMDNNLNKEASIKIQESNKNEENKIVENKIENSKVEDSKSEEKLSCDDILSSFVGIPIIDKTNVGKENGKVFENKIELESKKEENLVKEEILNLESTNESITEIKNELENKVNVEIPVETKKEETPVEEVIKEEKIVEEMEIIEPVITHTYDYMQMKSTDGEELGTKMQEVTESWNENAESIKRIKEYVGYLLAKQQNHARVAQVISGRYSALNNSFEMRRQLDILTELNNKIYEKIEYIYNFEKPTAVEKLDNILKVNLQIGILINYLTNPKSSVGRTKINRFEEMAIIEENEFKRNVADLLRDLRGEAELKKLNDDMEIIEDKNPLQKFVGIFTGRNKLDETMIEQIIIRQEAIKRTLARDLRLDYNYSIHELVAETEMFIRENEDDELVENEVKRLKIIEEELKENFVVLEEKVKNIINEREGRNLLIDDKVTREELVELETKRFLKKYRYDEKENTTPEVEYQDTTANEISRIIDYIKTSNIIAN